MNGNVTKKTAVAAAALIGMASASAAFAGNPATTSPATTDLQSCNVTSLVAAARQDNCTPQGLKLEARGDSRHRARAVVEFGIGDMQAGPIERENGNLGGYLGIGKESLIYGAGFEQEVSRHFGVKVMYLDQGSKNIHGGLSYGNTSAQINGRFSMEGISVQAVFYEDMGTIKPFIEAGVYVYNAEADATVNLGRLSVYDTRSGSLASPLVGIGFEVPVSDNINFLLELQHMPSTSSKYEISSNMLLTGLSVSF